MRYATKGKMPSYVRDRFKSDSQLLRVRDFAERVVKHQKGGWK